MFGKETHAFLRATFPPPDSTLPRHLRYEVDELRTAWCRAERFGQLAEADELNAQIDAIYQRAGVARPANEYRRPR